MNEWDATFFWTQVYAAEPISTTALDSHHSNDLISCHHTTAITVWAAAFAVPLMLCVSAEVTWICHPELLLF